ncbi:plc-like phosphodiesterase protein [Rutstroemia sp. NJR-2017a WRK4]|nr:plc-like phosphodiesterase protein [Rutstroemia sp. NJR-2017a WRK4]
MASITKGAMLFTLFMFSPVVLAARTAYVDLINATPYDWVLVHQHSYRMDWEPPATVSSGENTETLVKWKKNNKDAAAEATYKLDNPNEFESFTIRARQNPTRIEVVFQEELTSLNNPKNSVINLGYLSKGAHPFILAGDGVNSSYIGTNPPTAWMQATLPTIGQKTLRTITLPLSHNAGASEVSHSLAGPGILHNTQTQSVPVYSQLVFGARVLDIRPIFYKGDWLTYHGSLLWGRMWGATGQRISSIVNDINRFTKDYPGELIILDITHDANSEKKYMPFDDENWHSFYEMLGLIEDLWVEKEGTQYDLSKEPLSAFITPGSKSAVLIRLPCEAPAPFPGKSNGVKRALGRGKRDACPKRDLYNPQLALDLTPTSVPSSIESPSSNSSASTPKPSTIHPRSPFSPQTFIPSPRLPCLGSYSLTSSPSTLSADQISKLRIYKPTADSPILQTSWTLTQPVFRTPDFASKGTSILGYAVAAQRALFGELWGVVTGLDLGLQGDRDGGKEGVEEIEVGNAVVRKPNWVEVDGLRNKDVAALAVAVNWWEG